MFKVISWLLSCCGLLWLSNTINIVKREGLLIQLIIRLSLHWRQIGFDWKRSSSRFHSSFSVRWIILLNIHLRHSIIVIKFSFSRVSHILWYRWFSIRYISPRKTSIELYLDRGLFIKILILEYLHRISMLRQFMLTTFRRFIFALIIQFRRLIYHRLINITRRRRYWRLTLIALINLARNLHKFRLNREIYNQFFGLLQMIILIVNLSRFILILLRGLVI